MAQACIDISSRKRSGFLRNRRSRDLVKSSVEVSEFGPSCIDLLTKLVCFMCMLVSLFGIKALEIVRRLIEKSVGL